MSTLDALLTSPLRPRRGKYDPVITAVMVEHLPIGCLKSTPLRFVAVYPALVGDRSATLPHFPDYHLRGTNFHDLKSKLADDFAVFVQWQLRTVPSSGRPPLPDPCATVVLPSKDGDLQVMYLIQLSVEYRSFSPT